MTSHDLRSSKDRRGGRSPAPALLAAPVLLAVLAASTPGWADAAPGAAACTGCHGPAALGSAIPSLDGHAAEDIVAQMQAFRSGERKATVMDRIARGYTEEETRAIAEWLAKPEAARHAQP
ncbi:c-type cytochrome [Mesorhizobium sp. YC-39]|uniref:c-type cytochrome n=1 Tax=unclassified Mesorhizobium TaxID=325217 RepID=UPI0021E81F2D|nr:MULTISPECIES: c-type cytochrome [unclassified Mesorhizobium]MCV3207370.1 c-type cytochrome [Mesorhizobium sp. YC-2]MCV3229097.1 c-type cytochrome [Mesorhizobium sp. YC-39]